MTPKEKAIALLDVYENYFYDDIQNNFTRKYIAKQCALIAVDMILDACLQLEVEYWEEVKKEIENL